MDATALVTAVGASSLAEVAWPAGDGRPGVRGAVALVRGDRPALAFTYADEEVARAVAGSASVTLTLTEPRSTTAGFTPLRISAVPRLVEDPEGEMFVEELLVQELRRFPPSRLYADSPLLCREHWWYLPRLVVELEPTAARPVRPRSRPDDHLLVVGGADGLDVQVARVAQTRGDSLLLELERSAPSGPAVLFGQDASFPDLERWAQWRYLGVHDDGRLLVEEAPTRTGIAPVPGLWLRWRRQRDLEQRCRRAIPGPVR